LTSLLFPDIINTSEGRKNPYKPEGEKNE